MPRTAILLWLLVFCVPTDSALAQVITSANWSKSPVFREFLVSQKNINTLAHVAKERDRINDTPCGEDYRIEILRTIVEKPIHLADREPPFSAGQWRVQFYAIRCGRTNLLSMGYQVETNGELNSRNLWPGETLAHEDTINDAWRQIVLNYLSIEPSLSECKALDQAHILDTRVTKPVRLPTWEETWFLRACGQNISLKICFTYRQPGGGILMSSGGCNPRAP